METLKGYRDRIDDIDAKIRELFLERMTIVDQIAKAKMEKDMQIYDSSREDQVKKKNLNAVKQEEYKEYYSEVLETILKVSKDFQRALIFRSAQ
ncbi:MAG TPA: chorismate mutase [Bacillota bacterium]|nr:chorismate mutase [Bacillota bacterium]HPF42971.1 chorismate mutase [Bacillota bacterium]HPJ86379.1 chorismate mutase [Bacillota bacterium]HPQ62288.1 chorismate mutase [Bacillota bacterium]HRX92056.1 chorismate mutase [Candidatus Izemoplasmatales bacterium]